MAVIHAKAKKVPKSKSESEVLGEATRRLLKGIKDHVEKQGKPLTHAELLRRGYSKEFIAQLKAA